MPRGCSPRQTRPIRRTGRRSRRPAGPEIAQAVVADPDYRAAGGGGAAAFFLLRPSHAEPKVLPPAQYIALEPAFIVNLADTDGVRYLQADVQLQTRDPDTVAAIGLHTPIIRNRLLLLFGQQTSQQLTGRTGKERLQAQALAEVRAVLKAQHAANKVDALLFTSVVIQ